MIDTFATWLVYTVFALPADAPYAAAIHFFIYDSIKILLLLFALIFVIGVVRTYLPQRTIRRWMKKRGVAANVFASFFGAVTPFCSCSSIPIFLGFLEAGIPLGVTFSFLITSPLINEYLVVLMIGFFGVRITAAYVASGLIIGTVAGIVLGRMGLERYLMTDLIEKRKAGAADPVYADLMSRLRYGLREASGIVGKLWLWVLVGVGIGALIHNYVPDEAIQRVISKAGLFSVPIATLLGVPMYGSCAAIVPVAVVLFQKGIPLGTALAFMMAIAALSLPEAMILRRAMRLRLIAIFFGVTALGIVFTGYLFNFLSFN